MGGVEGFLSGKPEPSVRDHSLRAKTLKSLLESGRLTVPGGEFIWGGCLDDPSCYSRRGPFSEKKKANSAIC